MTDDGGNGAKDLAAPPPRWDDGLFAAFRISFGALLRAWFRMRVEGPLPPPGACVLAANHTSFVDPLVLGAVVPRRIVYLMTEVVWRSPAFGWFYRWNRAIPVSTRGGNRDAMRVARAVLEQGRMIGIFPEGGLSRDGLPMLGNPGAVALVLQSNVPIVPVGVRGAHAAMPPGAVWPRPSRITVHFGAPILPAEFAALATDRRERLRESVALIMRRIAALSGATAREDEIRKQSG